MADHLLIGILIGVVCGIAALLVISIVTLRRIDLEWRTRKTDLVAPAATSGAALADAVMS